MPLDEKVLGFTNIWYEPAIEAAETRKILPDVTIRVISAPYFCATKLEAFDGRGAGAYQASHDLEDIITVIDGRAEIIDEISHAPVDVFRRNVFITAESFKGFLTLFVPENIEFVGDPVFVGNLRQVFVNEFDNQFALASQFDITGEQFGNPFIDPLLFFRGRTVVIGEQAQNIGDIDFVAVHQFEFKINIFQNRNFCFVPTAFYLVVKIEIFAFVIFKFLFGHCQIVKKKIGKGRQGIFDAEQFAERFDEFQFVVFRNEIIFLSFVNSILLEWIWLLTALSNVSKASFTSRKTTDLKLNT